MSTKSTYQRFNQGAARLMFILGLGMVAVILGSILSVGLAMRLGPRLQGLPLPMLQVLDLLIRNLWCLVVLPLFVLAAARVTDLRTWSTAAGSLATGSFFLLMLGYLQRGGSEVWRGAWDFISWVVVMGVSAMWIRRAVLKGAQHREAQAQKAKAQAAAKVSEYDVFRAEAEAQGERHAAREADGGQAATIGSDAAVPLSAAAGPLSAAADDFNADAGEAPGETASPAEGTDVSAAAAEVGTAKDADHDVEAALPVEASTLKEAEAEVVAAGDPDARTPGDDASEDGAASEVASKAGGA